MNSYSKNTQYRQRPKVIIANGYRIIHPTHEQLIEAGWAVDQFAPLGEWQRHSASPVYADGVAFWNAQEWPLEQIAEAQKQRIRAAAAGEIEGATGTTSTGDQVRLTQAGIAVLDRRTIGAPRPDDEPMAAALRHIGEVTEAVYGKEKALLAAISDALAAGDGEALRAITWQ